MNIGVRQQFCVQKALKSLACGSNRAGNLSSYAGKRTLSDTPQVAYVQQSRAMSSAPFKVTVTKGYINGEWRDAKSKKTFKVTNPSTGDVIAEVPEMGVEETVEAIHAAKTAFESWKKTSPRERSRLLRRLFDACIAKQSELGALITAENGKPLAEAKGEAAYGSSFLEWFSEEAPRIYGDTLMTENVSNRVITMKQPIGVCGIITPFNFPLAMITRKLGAALAAGCTVVIKPDAFTPLTCLEFTRIAEEVGVPKGVINVVTGMENGPAIGKELTSNPIVRKISFTGSTRVGKILMEQSASTMKKVSMELGGNAPFIVFDDANLEEAVSGAIMCKFRGTGQTCVCANRIYVQEGIYDAFVKALVAKVKTFKLGDGFGEGVTHGPLIHDRAITKVKNHVEDAVSRGGTIEIGGKSSSIGELFFEPTVISGMTSDMAIASEETFGPVAGIWKFKTEEEVVELANNSDVGLAGYLYSRDVKRAWRVQEALEVGMVGVNTGIISSAAAPFGGVKESGIGREGSKYGLDDFIIVKSATFAIV